MAKLQPIRTESDTEDSGGVARYRDQLYARCRIPNFHRFISAASGDARPIPTESEMFKAAKYANAFWYPQQSLEQAVMFKAAQNLNVDQVDAREWVSLNFSSAAGFKNVHQWLADNGLLKSGPNGGNSCGV